MAAELGSIMTKGGGGREIIVPIWAKARLQNGSCCVQHVLQFD